ncbi:hypothetical protein K469DRAFT_175367 [Zopfia rhizophila CBS 207.26]|uniref:Uncharacterized protein n=1 Tax=Zopfia rhizophila CBS 207.26 TaxID=1314779 RepID=A0A6A6E404_9PEZI|nr:hypothetical protein K469DRAFT_175367 [Zopfia rhizophila CBS 207.26]
MVAKPLREFIQVIRLGIPPQHNTRYEIEYDLLIEETGEFFLKSVIAFTEKRKYNRDPELLNLTLRIQALPGDPIMPRPFSYSTLGLLKGLQTGLISNETIVIRERTNTTSKINSSQSSCPVRRVPTPGYTPRHIRSTESSNPLRTGVEHIRNRKYLLDYEESDRASALDTGDVALPDKGP